MNLDEVLGSPTEIRKKLGENTEKYVMAEEKIIKFLTKHDRELSRLNKQVESSAKELKTLVNGDDSGRAEKKLAELYAAMDSRTAYMVTNYYMLYPPSNNAYNLVRGPDDIIEMDDETLNGLAVQLHMFSKDFKTHYKMEKPVDANALRAERLIMGYSYE